MRLRLPLLGAALIAALALAAPAGAAPLHSDNVSLVTKLPEAVGAASARFSEDGRTMYVSTWKGLLIYDVTKPEDPQRVGFLPLPHFENEDVDAGGGLVIITNDPSEGLGLIYVIDVSNPAVPTIRSIIRNGDILGVSNQIAGDGTQSNTGHIANCLEDCKYLWTTGTSEGLAIFDLNDPDHPKYAGKVKVPGGGFTHDVFIDRSGIAWVTGEDGTFGYTIDDPTDPQLVYRSDESIRNTGGGLPGDDGSGPLDFLHHNSIRTDISLDPTFKRPPAKPGVGSRVEGGGLGDVVAITEEDYAKPGCKGQGSIQTWQIMPGQTNSDGSTKLRLLDYWTTELNELQNLEGRTAADGEAPTTVMCSAHWFDESGGILAQGWYDQGVRFMDVNDPLHIKQVGYWVTQGMFWGAYYAPTDPKREIVYGLDVTSGIDVLKIDRGAATKAVAIPLTDQYAIRASRKSAKALGLVPSGKYGYSCPLLSPDLAKGTKGLRPAKVAVST